MMRKGESTGKTDAINKAVQMLLAVITLPSLMSCGSRAFDRAVKTADSLTEVNQHGALAFIDSINAAGGNKPGRSKSMKLALLKAKARNKLCMPLSDDTLKMLEEYYGSHGTANERMLANYIIGCSFLDKNDAPMALQYFQYAAEKADTTRDDCDYRTLHKVHVQAAQLLKNQHAFKHAMDENRLALKYALKAKDTVNALITMEQKANIYNRKDDIDSAILIREKLRTLYLKHGYKKLAAISLGPLINKMREMGEIDKARHYMNIYEKESGLFDMDGNIEKGRETYYTIKGYYYLSTNRIDSAIFYFSKCLKTTTHQNDFVFCYKGFADVYRKLGYNDSVAKYADLALKAQDTAYARLSTEHLQSMQVMYDYTRNKRIAEQKTEEAARYKYWITVLGLVFTLTVFIILFILQKRQKDKERQKKMNASNAMYLLLLQKKEKELDDAENAIKKNRKLIDEKIDEIRKLRENIISLHGDSLKHDNLNNCINASGSPVTDRLHEHAGSGEKATQTDKSSLIQHVQDTLPEFISTLGIEENRLNETEVIVCCFVKLCFIPSEITCLLGISSQNLTNIRKRLNRKIFGKDGGAKDFDYRIRRLTPAE